MKRVASCSILVENRFIEHGSCRCLPYFDYGKHICAKVENNLRFNRV